MMAFSKSPKHFIQYRNRKWESTPAMELGTAFHKYFLEGETAFHEAYIVHEKMDMRRKENKAAMVELVENSNGKSLIDEVGFSTILRMTESVSSDKFAGKLFGSCNVVEQKLTFKIGGLPFVGYVDAAKRGDDGYWFDLKTTNDASPKAFKGKFFSMGYNIQHAVYYEALRQNCFDVTMDDAYTVAVETVSPHGVGVYKMSEARIQAGLDEVNRRVEMFKKCMDTQSWDQGYTFNNGVITID